MLLTSICLPYFELFSPSLLVYRVSPPLGALDRLRHLQVPCLGPFMSYSALVPDLRTVNANKK